MNRALLGSTLIAAASLALSAPAPAQSFVAGSFTGSSGLRDFSFAAPPPPGVRVHRGFDHRDHRRMGYGFGVYPNRFFGRTQAGDGEGPARLRSD